MFLTDDSRTHVAYEDSPPVNTNVTINLNSPLVIVIKKIL
jgi:hypothetical protein